MSTDRPSSALAKRIEFFLRERPHSWSPAHLRVADALVSDLATRLFDVEAERDILAAKVAACDAAADHVAMCPDCGEVETCDEDRCCSCGSDLLVFADRHSAELYQEGQQRNADAIATLRMQVAEVHEVLCSDADETALRAAVASLCYSVRRHGDDR